MLLKSPSLDPVEIIAKGGEHFGVSKRENIKNVILTLLKKVFCHDST